MCAPWLCRDSGKGIKGRRRFQACASSLTAYSGLWPLSKRFLYRLALESRKHTVVPSAALADPENISNQAEKLRLLIRSSFKRVNKLAK